MEILKGKVQDPGFEDVECTYLKADDGSVYIFVPDGQLPNGNIIATPVLKEGIGHAPNTSLGLITPAGQILIPFENKNIKVLKNNLLLVERNVPQTPSVVDASSKQSDPLSASTFIETANTIKEQLKGVIGINGNYLFDNQFSEAALYTQEGANVGGGYFSYIFETSDDSYFMCSNVVGESIMKYDAVVREDQTEVSDVQNEEQPTAEQNDNVDEASGISGVEIPAIANQVAEGSNEEVPANQTPEVNSPEEANSNSPVPEINVAAPPEEEQSSDGGTVNEEAVNSEAQGEVSLPTINLNQEEVPSNEDSSNEGGNESKLENTDTEEVDGGEEVENSSEVVEESESSEETEVSSDEEIDEEQSDLKLNIGDDIETSDEEEMSEDNSEEVEEDVEESSDEYTEETEAEDENDLDDSQQEFEDDSNQEDENDEEYEDKAEDSQDEYLDDENSNPIILDATNTIRKLLEENRKQRQLIDQQESEIEALNSSNEIYKEENASMNEEATSLRNSIKKYRSENTNLARDNTRLQSTVSRQEEIIDHLKTQNTTLKEQVAGIQALGHAVAEANTIFTSSNDESYETSSSEDSGFSYLGEDDGFQYTKKAA